MQQSNLNEIAANSITSNRTASLGSNYTNRKANSVISTNCTEKSIKFERKTHLPSTCTVMLSFRPVILFLHSYCPESAKPTDGRYNFLIENTRSPHKCIA